MSSYSDRITQASNSIAGALHLANQRTGAGDTGICDAVATLINGYGGGVNTYPFLPSGADLVASGQLVWNLATDTDYLSKTPTTSAQIIKAQGAPRSLFEIDADFDTYEYSIFQSVLITPVYDCDATFGYLLSGELLASAIYGWIDMSGTGRNGMLNSQGNYILNLNSSNVMTVIGSAYGVYASTGSYSSASYFSKSTKIGVATPQITMRLNATYASESSFEHLIANETNIYVNYEVYKYTKINGVFARLKNIQEG